MPNHTFGTIYIYACSFDFIQIRITFRMDFNENDLNNSIS